MIAATCSVAIQSYYRSMRLLVGALVAMGCGGGGEGQDAGVDAPHPATVDGVQPFITVVSYGTGMLVRGGFTVVDATADRLLPPDAIATVTFRGAIVDLSRQGPTNTYAATVPITAPVTEGEEVTCSLTLADATATATATTPAPFTIDSHTGSFTSPPITVTWSPTSTDPMKWQAVAHTTANHVCGVGGTTQGTIPDTGSFTLDNPMVGGAGGYPCWISFDLVRTRTGTTAGFAPDGTLETEQRRSAF